MLIPHSSELVIQQAIHEELHVSLLYKHLANQCQRLGLFGSAKFFRAESSEELGHYEKLADFLNDRGAVAELPTVEGISEAIPSLDAAVDMALRSEIELGNKYVSWYSSLLTTDPMTAQFLLQFIEIQRLSIGDYLDLQSRLKMAADVILIDQELGNG